MHPNAEIVMRGFQAFAEGNAEAMREILADDVVWHSSGRGKWGGDYHGADATLKLFADISAEAEVENVPHAILADDDHVVVLINVTARRGDETHENHNVFVMHVDDGKLSEAWVMTNDVYAWDEFWGT